MSGSGSRFPLMRIGLLSNRGPSCNRRAAALGGKYGNPDQVGARAETSQIAIRNFEGAIMRALDGPSNKKCAGFRTPATGQLGRHR
jgi:hypothetical protein